MLFVKTLITLLLFLTVLIQPFAFVSLMERIVYTGIIIPILLQKIWFGYWINYKNKKVFWINILFSIFFITASVFVIDIFLIMKDLALPPDIVNENNLMNVLLFVMNRLLFFFAIIYLWNGPFFGKNNKILYYIFNILRIFYTIVAVPVIIWLFCMLMIGQIYIVQ